MTPTPLLSIRGLKKYFPVKTGAFSGSSLLLKAVDGVDLDVYRGETLGLVGESGCGKTTLGRCVLRLYETDAGRVFFDAPAELIRTIDELSPGERAVQLRKYDILSMDRHTLKQTRRRIQMIFQDPWASLNPQMLIGDILAEGPREYRTHRGAELTAWVHALLDHVGLARSAAGRYPHEFSGGQRQRIGIARALSVQPSLIVCDEPVSALDVSIQAQILNLLISLQQEFGLTYLFVAHNLSVVQYVSDRVAVMYLGKVVELARSEDLYRRPRHPYTIGLLASVPIADPDRRADAPLPEGEVPSPVNPPSGCAFHPRCPYKTDICTRVAPGLVRSANEHAVACHNPPSG